jgi:hypothetical protein
MYFDLLSHQPARRRRLAPWLSTDNLVRRWKEYRAVILTVVAGLVLVLGTIGFAKVYPRDRPFDSLYRAVQLFAFGGNVDSRPNLWLEIARFLAPLVIGYAAINIVIGLYRDQFRWFLIRGLRNHIVIAGLGDAGSMMASSFDRENWRVIAIEQDAASPAIQTARERGIWVVQGDATDPHILRRAGVRRASLFMVMCGNDGTNVDVAAAARRVSHGRGSGILTTVVDLHDFELWQTMKAQALVDRDHSAFRLELFNIHGLAADMLIDQYPAFGPGDPGSPHVLFVGMDGVAISVIIGLLKRWRGTRPEPERRFRITIADRSPEPLQAQLVACYPEIASIAGVELRTWRVDVSSLGRLAQLPEAVSAIYVCLVSETQALTAALALRQHPGLWDGAPIVLAVSDESAGVGAAISRGGQALERVRAFGVLSRTLTPEALLHTATEVIAELGHDFYRREQFARGKSEATDRSLVTWKQLSPDLRESNRLWADGIAAHLSDLRLVVAPAPLMSPDEPLFEFTAEEVEHLAPLEHARWEDAMTRIGYRQGPTRTAHTHPMIGVPFDQLPEANKDKDRAHVRAIPVILAQAGFRVSRLSPAPTRQPAKVEVGSGAPNQA